MRELVKLLLIPITGCVAIGLIFLLVVEGGEWRDDVVNQQGRVGLAVEQLDAVDARLHDTGRCDPDLYTPVCGFDGNTYDNPCVAVRAGTAVAYRGGCGPR